MSSCLQSCTSISIHAPRGGSDHPIIVNGPPCADFNPRSPWGERRSHWHLLLPGRRFQSTLPVGGATGSKAEAKLSKPISIHAPRGGSDSALLPVFCFPADFNPRSPWGERLLRAALVQQPLRDFNPRSPWGERLDSYRFPLRSILFQSTLPVGGATDAICAYALFGEISIHAPRGGSDASPGTYPSCSNHFNPRSPWGERPVTNSRRFRRW